MSDYQTKYQEIKGSLAILMQQNNVLKQQLKEAYEELQEKQQLKEEWADEVQRVSETIQQLQIDNQYLQQDNEQLNRNCQESKYVIEQQIEQITMLKDQNDKYVGQLDQSRQQNLQKEILLKQQREEFTRQLEQLQQQHFEEIKKLQGIIDNQSGLIQSYEKLNEIEKSDAQNSHHHQQILVEDQMIELKNRNVILTNKINEEKQKYDQLFEQHKDEVSKLQGIIKEQKELLTQYERIIERDKKQQQQSQQQQIQIQTPTQQQQMQQFQQIQQPQQISQIPQQVSQIPQQIYPQQYTPLYSQPNLQTFQPISYDKYSQPTQQTYLHTQPTQPITHRPPKTYFTNNKIQNQLQQIVKDGRPSKDYSQKRSFYMDEDQLVEKEFQEEFLNKFQNVIGRMEDKLYQMQSELNISGLSEKPRKLK